MKKTILAMTAAAVIAAGAPQAEARVNGWVLAGGILGGVALGSALSHSHVEAPCYSAPCGSYSYYPPAPVVYAPQPVCSPYVAPAPLVPVAPTVVYQAPPPVVVYQPAPVCYRPAPVFSVGIEFGGGRGHWEHHNHGGYYHGRW